MRLLNTFSIFRQNGQKIMPKDDAKMYKTGLDPPLVHLPILPSQNNHIVNSLLHDLKLPFLAKTKTPITTAHQMLLKRLEKSREVRKVGTDGPVHMYCHCDLQPEQHTDLLLQQIMGRLRRWFEEERIIVSVPIAECIHYIFQTIQKIATINGVNALQEERSLKIVNQLKIHLQLFETLPLVHRQRSSFIFKECVLKSLSCAQTLLWIDLQQFGEKVLAFIGKMSRQFESAKLITLAFLREGRLDHQHLVHQNSNTPTVYLVVIEASLSNFRADVIQSPTKCLPLPVSLDGPPKISDLQQISKADNILRLQIAMHDAVPMQVINAIKYLYEVFGSFILIEWASPQYLLVKVMEAVLHNKKNLIPTDMVAVSGQDIRMLTVEMYLHLFDEELQLNLIFLKGFECHNDMVDIGYRKDDLSCLTLAQLLQHLQLIPRLLAVLHVCHFLKCLVHVLQLFIDVEIFLEVLVVQPHWYFVILEFLFDIIDIASTVDVVLQDFL